MKNFKFTKIVSVTCVIGCFANVAYVMGLEEMEEMFLHSASVEVIPQDSQAVFDVGECVTLLQADQKDISQTGRIVKDFGDSWAKIRWEDSSLDVRQTAFLKIAINCTNPDAGTVDAESCPPTQDGSKLSLDRVDLVVGAMVTRGPDWIWGDQDGGNGCLGRVVDIAWKDFITVRWIHSDAQPKRYRFGSGVHDVYIIKSNLPKREVNIQLLGRPVPLESQPDQLSVGTWVVRGKDWKWGDQDGIPPNTGEVIAFPRENWVKVRWHHNNNTRNYRYGKNKKFDLQVSALKPNTPSPRPKSNVAIGQPEDLQIGDIVIRGPDWRWGSQDGGKEGLGLVMSNNQSGWYRVKWCCNHKLNQYRMKPNNVDLLRVIHKTLLDCQMQQTFGCRKPLNGSTERPPSSIISKHSLEVGEEDVTAVTETKLVDSAHEALHNFTDTSTLKMVDEGGPSDGQMPPLQLGDKVKRNNDNWIWNEEEGQGTGVVVRLLPQTEWVLVRWPNGHVNAYRYHTDVDQPGDITLVLPADADNEL